MFGLSRASLRRQEGESMRDFEGKVAVVTGGASGMGLGMATRFAEQGMKVVLADVEEPALEAAVTRLRQAEHDVIGVVTDVSKVESVEALAQKTLQQYGKVHVLCNNAGVGGGGGSVIWESTLKDWQWTLGVNLWGVIYGIHTFVPIMLEQDEEGHVVNTASMAGLTPSNRPYSISKHGVVSLSEALHEGLRERGAKVHASVLCPGVVNTSIMFSTRNRPAELHNSAGATPGERELRRSAAVHKYAEEHGLDPLEVGDRVVDAIRNEQFWILTHEEYDDVIRTRVEDILARRNPTPITTPLGIRGITGDEDESK
jgi:NAD(P)-dependent dehydrogenase (short-subunit alcohol dehydrogenase family)